ncbi:[acyl-carrier-protein] S-malonyltransferase [candidate division BRC1 bacterium HGW-BRC1-1]|nr:MAG: [acyl-carrier-protein] S-malonyltransferase [candidate division BRC1 bacterium HGW-BRC1-1]
MADTSRAAFVFPGQGAQFVGMGAELAEHSAAARDLFSQTNEILGRDLLKVMREGPEEDLKRTENTQPAVVAFSTALLNEVTARGIKASVVAGHSLGEYTALVASGVLTFAEVMKLVELRGKLMGRAGDQAPGGMAAVMGLADDKLAEICEQTPGIVVVANYNSPGQTVVSGENAAVAAACESFKAAGAKRALMLPVAGAFHSPLMAQANEELMAAIDALEFREPAVAVVTNVDGAAHQNSGEIRSLLKRQMVSGVHWTKSVETMRQLGVGHYIEIGPGKVLAGLIKRIDKEAQTSGVASWEESQALNA